MIRIIFLNLFLFLLPFLGYGLYLLVRTGRIDVQQELTGKRFFWLIGAGVVSVIAGLVWFATFESGRPAAVYEPARYEDGVVKPGGFREPSASEPDQGNGPGS